MPKQQPKKEVGSVINKSSITLGTLAKNTAILSAAPTVTRGGQILSMSIGGGINGFTAGNGPLLYGIMSSDLSLTELEAYLELEGPLSPSDITSSEVASRGKVIRILATFTTHRDWINIHNQSMSGLKFSEAGEATGAWTSWIYNLGTALDTGGILELLERAFVEWNPSG